MKMLRKQEYHLFAEHLFFCPAITALDSSPKKLVFFEVHPAIAYLQVISCQPLLGGNTIERALNRSPIPLSCMRAGRG